MKYGEVTNIFNKQHTCPFCREYQDHMLEVTEHFFVIPARAPYVPNHLLIVPKRHVILLQELTQEELQNMHELIDTRAKKLHAYHSEVNLLLRDGLVSGLVETGKSVGHFHFHLIPDCDIGAKNADDSWDREFLDDEKYFNLAQKLRELFS